VHELRHIIEKYIGAPSKGKRPRVSSKKRFEELLQDTKDSAKPEKQKKKRAKTKISVEPETGDTALKAKRKTGGKHKSTQKKLEAIVKDCHVR